VEGAQAQFATPPLYSIRKRGRGEKRKGVLTGLYFRTARRNEKEEGKSKGGGGGLPIPNPSPLVAGGRKKRKCGRGRTSPHPPSPDLSIEGVRRKVLVSSSLLV